MAMPVHDFGLHGERGGFVALTKTGEETMPLRCDLEQHEEAGAQSYLQSCWTSCEAEF